MKNTPRCGQSFNLERWLGFYCFKDKVNGIQSLKRGWVQKNCSLKLSGVIDLTNWCWHVQKRTGFQPKLVPCQTENSWSRCSSLMRSLSGLSITEILSIKLFLLLRFLLVWWSSLRTDLFSPGLLEYVNSCGPSWKCIRAKSFPGIFFSRDGIFRVLSLF